MNPERVTELRPLASATEQLQARFASASKTASSIMRWSAIVKQVGILFAVILALCAASSLSRGWRGDAIPYGLLGVLAVVIGYIVSALFAGLGQLLGATLITAINTTQSLSEDGKTELISSLQSSLRGWG
jgi:hypothetical protein